MSDRLFPLTPSDFDEEKNPWARYFLFFCWWIAVIDISALIGVFVGALIYGLISGDW